MDKLIVRGTEINVQWDLKRDDFLSLTDIAKIKDNDNPQRNLFCLPRQERFLCSIEKIIVLWYNQFDK